MSFKYHLQNIINLKKTVCYTKSQPIISIDGLYNLSKPQFPPLE